MMSQKRNYGDVDPDYEDVTEQQQKRQKLLEEDAKETTVRKIEHIIHKHFNVEIQKKEEEIDIIDQRLHQARSLLDRLRACIVANYYSRESQQSGHTNPNQPPVIHPAVKKLVGKTVPQSAPLLSAADDVKQETNARNNVHDTQNSTGSSTLISKVTLPDSNQVTKAKQRSTKSQGQSSRFKVKKRVVVGNVSKYIPLDKRDDNDQATHKWMVYVRGSREEPRVDGFVDKVWFFLHPSYRPNDLVEINQPPFHLTRRGWGEFPIRVQLHFTDTRNKRVDIIHRLKLDKTYTGIQTLGSETHIDLELENVASSLMPSPLTPQITSSHPVLQHHRTSTPAPHLHPPHSQTASSQFSCHKPEGSEPDVKQSDNQSVVSELESENSLGVVWSQDHDKPREQCRQQQVDYFESSTMGEGQQQGIMGNGDVLLSSGAFKDLQTIAVTDLNTRSRAAPLPVPLPHAPPPQAPPPQAPPPHRSRTPSKLQISRSLTPQGWTRLQIKQEEGDSQSNSSGYGTSKTPEIKEEPMDDSYQRPSRLSTPRNLHRSDPGFQPVGAMATETSGSGPSGSGWTHVQIKSEPVTPDRPTSSCSGRTDHRSMASTPDKAESQASIPSSPATPDRIVRFEIGRNMSPGLKLNVADPKNMLDIQRQGASSARQSSNSPSVIAIQNKSKSVASPSQNIPRSAASKISKSLASPSQKIGKASANVSSQSVQDNLDFSHWKPSQVKGKQSMTLGVGLGQLSASSQSRVDTSVTKGLTLKTMLTQNLTSVSSASVSSVQKEDPQQRATPVPKVAPAAQDNVYVQCMDASGNVFLIPQQMLKSTLNLGSQNKSQEVPKANQPKPHENSKAQLQVQVNTSESSMVPAESKPVEQPKPPGYQAHTTVVGSGPNKATLTYMMSPQGSPTSTSTTTSPTIVPVTTSTQLSVPISTARQSGIGQNASAAVTMTTQGQVHQAPGRGQKLVLIPGALSPRPLTVMASKNTIVSGMALSGIVRKAQVPSQTPIIRDQVAKQLVGSAQIPTGYSRPPVPSGLQHTAQTSTDVICQLPVPNNVPTTTQGKLVSRSTVGKPQIVQPGLVIRTPIKAAVHTAGLSTMGAPALAISQKDGAEIAIQASPGKSLIISKDSLSQLQPGHLLQVRPSSGQVQRPETPSPIQKTMERSQTVLVPGKGAKPLLGALSMASQQHGSASSQLMVIAGTAQQQLMAGQGTGTQSSKKAFVGNGNCPSPRLGLSASKTPGGVSLLRPGLILAKSVVPASTVYSNANLKSSQVDMETDGETRIMDTDVGGKEAAISCGIDKKQDTLTMAKPQCNQSLLKSAIGENLQRSLVKTGASGSKPSQPLFLTTKIGNQTVLLKIEQPKSTGVSKVPAALGAGAAESSCVGQGANVKLVNGDSLKSERVNVAPTGTIRHGSILGIGRSKDERPATVEPNINFSTYHSMQGVLSCLAQKYPLVNSTVDRSQYPYCAHTEEHYLRWNVGKRRASEWLRARRIRRRLVSAQQEHDIQFDIRVWSTREIVEWCRQYCYTPLDLEISRKLSRSLKPVTRGQHQSYITYSDHQRVLSDLSQLPADTPGGSSDDDDIDIVGFSRSTREVKKEVPDPSSDVNTVEMIPPSPLAQYVRGVAQQIGVSYRPVPVCDEPCVMSSLAEEVVISALKLFMDGILRESAAGQYRGQRYPQELGADDIHRTLNSLPHCDFLTNANFGSQPHNISTNASRTNH